LAQLIEILYALPAMLIAITIHEYSHGRMADYLGDPTPRLSGRLSLNPIVHLDLMGSLVFIVTRRFGWAKPVPVSSHYFKDPKRDMLLVGIAGPAANFAMALLAALPLRFGIVTVNGYLFQVVLLIVIINVVLGIFNLIPIPPLDGSHIIKAFLPPSAMSAFRWFEQNGIIVLFLVLVFFPAPFFAIINPVISLIIALLLPGRSGWI
jgi:Zn-dependent protease